MEPPIKPDESDCCNSGCNPCILDVYEEQLKKYKQKHVNPIITYSNCISPTAYSIFKVINIEKLSEVAFLYSFEYVRPQKGEISKNNLGLHYEPGQHFLMKAKVKNEEFTRAYTPIPTDMENNGSIKFTALIKLYEYGKMSNYFRTIGVGAETLWRGPYGEFTINYNVKYLLLIAQGTGIAPIYSVIYNMVNNEDCYTFLKLFFCCRDCDNIYLRDQLYKLCSNWNFTYEIFLSKPGNVCAKYNEIIHKNKLDFNEIHTYLLNKHEVVNITICGSEDFTQNIRNYVVKCKVKEENVFCF